MSHRSRSTRCLTGIVLLAAALAAFGLATLPLRSTGVARANPNLSVPEIPPPGGLALAVTPIDDPQLLAAAQPFEVESVAAFDVDDQMFRVFIPGAPEWVNSLTAGNLEPGTIVWIKRRDVFAGPPSGRVAGATEAAPADFRVPPPGGLSPGVAETASPQELAAAQRFEVDSVFAFDVITQTWRVHIAKAPTVVNTLTADNLAPGTVVWVKRSRTTGQGAGAPGPVAASASAPPPLAPSAPAPAATGTATATPTPTPTASPTPTPTATPQPAGCQPVPTDRLALLADAVGFGRNARGGADGCLYVVTNANDSGPGSLRQGAEAGGRWIVFDRDMTVALKSTISLASNTTIDGRGRRVEVTGGGLYLVGPGKSNVIIENVTLSHAGQDSKNDLLRVNWATDFWFDHITFRDARDEYIDISRAPQSGTRGTISWSRFEQGGPLNTNELVILIGDQGAIPTNHLLSVTLHHNYFGHTRQRHPLMTGATVHSFNNFIGYRLAGFEVRCLGAKVCAQLVSENDVIDAGQAPSNNADWATHITDGGNRVRVTNPLIMGGAIVTEVDPAGAFDPAALYPYSLSPTAGLIELLQSQAGAR